MTLKTVPGPTIPAAIRAVTTVIIEDDVPSRVGVSSTAIICASRSATSLSRVAASASIAAADDSALIALASAERAAVSAASASDFATAAAEASFSKDLSATSSRPGTEYNRLNGSSSVMDDSTPASVRALIADLIESSSTET